MSEADRMERLEARVLALEKMIRELAGKRGSGEVGKGKPQPAVRIAQPSGAPGSPGTHPRASPRPRFPASPLSSEQWIGQRVLLAVGVVALILAAGYLLRLSFDRGWISPIMRCIGGASSGLVVGAVGWRL